MDDYEYGGLHTLLRISGFGVPPYSARGLSQTLEPIDQARAGIWRTINGGLLDVTAPQYRKYKSTITCNDQNAPALNGVWPGRSVIVDCVSTLVYITAGGVPERTVVEGSSYIEGDFTIYRPRLNMRVMSHSVNTDEYGAEIGWTMELEEE